ncbi:MATE family efflux transporter [Burkholderiales bacterium]|nr:MATE family efflux transporter [Burkholderiales bacterium]
MTKSAQNSVSGVVTGSPLVGAPLLPTMLRLAVPGVIGSMIQMLLIFVEIFLLNRAGTTALAAVATVFPLVMLANMLSAGAIGGATSGAVARALGSNDLLKAHAILRSAVFIAMLGGTLMGVIVTVFGPVFFYWVGARGDVLLAANAYARVIFFGIPLIWLFNMMCSVLRGAGAMTRSALAMSSVVLVYSSLGFWLIPEMNTVKSTNEIMTIAAYILLVSYAIGTVAVLILILLPGQPIRFNGFKVDWSIAASLLRSGLLAGTQSTATIAYSLIATGLLGRFSIDWLAGYGLAVRLELVMVPVIFGIGSALIAVVGAYAGAGQRARAIEVAWRGTIANIVIVGTIGLILGFNPNWWCAGLGGDQVASHCGTTLGILGPFYGFFAAGLGLYFASQGLNTLLWPVLGSLIRMLIVASGLVWLNFDWFGRPEAILWLVASAMGFYGVFVVLGLRFWAWRTR